MKAVTVYMEISENERKFVKQEHALSYVLAAGNQSHI